jgi:hypothetical protein
MKTKISPSITPDVLEKDPKNNKKDLLLNSKLNKNSISKNQALKQKKERLIVKNTRPFYIF